MAMYTSLTDGSVVAIGPSCAPAFVMGLAQSLGYVALPADVVPAEMGGALELPGMGDVLMQGNDEPVRRKRGARKVAPKDQEGDGRAQAGADQPEESTADKPTDATGADAGTAQDSPAADAETEQVSA